MTHERIKGSWRFVATALYAGFLVGFARGGFALLSLTAELLLLGLVSAFVGALVGRWWVFAAPIALFLGTIDLRSECIEYCFWAIPILLYFFPSAAGGLSIGVTSASVFRRLRRLWHDHMGGAPEDS